MIRLGRPLLYAAALCGGLLSAAAAENTVALPELAVEKREMHLDELLRNLDPAAIGRDYAAALAKNDRAAALRAAARYFRERPESLRYANLGKRKGNAAKADRGVRGEMIEVNIPWNFPDGRINFLFDPTAVKGPRNHEWVWQLNRHGFWGDMGVEFAKAGDAKYARAFNTQIRDWIAQTELPKKWNGPGSAWRTIEAGLRLMGAWPLAFEAFRKSPDFSDENLCLMLASMHRQSRHLIDHKTRANWLMMEMNGAYTFATLFPEFKDSAATRVTAARVLADALRDQILPDGMQDELSPDYHAVTFACASGMLQLAQQYQRTGELPPDFAPLLEKAAEAYLALATPRLTQPRTNDCYTMNTVFLMRTAADLFPQRADFRWAADSRQKGKAPSGATASRFLPYAGFIAMRSDWGPDATYLCFDVGPLGTNHQHQDMLNIHLYQGDEELIFDDGGGQYEISPTRSYGISAADHNTVLVDGMPQNRREPKKFTRPIDAGFVTTPAYDYARATYDGEFGGKRVKAAVHTREVRFSKPDFFCVVDTLRSADAKPHTYELLWHLDTLKMKPVPEFPGALLSDFGKKYEVLILPLFPDTVQVSTASGQMKPRVAGWYVGRNEAKLHPATTVFMKSAKVPDFRFATLLIPLRRGEALPTLKKLGADRFEITLRGRTEILDLAKLAEVAPAK